MTCKCSGRGCSGCKKKGPTGPTGPGGGGSGGAFLRFSGALGSVSTIPGYPPPDFTVSGTQSGSVYFGDILAIPEIDSVDPSYSLITPIYSVGHPITVDDLRVILQNGTGFTLADDQSIIFEFGTLDASNTFTVVPGATATIPGGTVIPLGPTTLAPVSFGPVTLAIGDRFAFRGRATGGYTVTDLLTVTATVSGA